MLDVPVIVKPCTHIARTPREAASTVSCIGCLFVEQRGKHATQQSSQSEQLAARHL
jgi:hypothetical protein